MFFDIRGRGHEAVPDLSRDFHDDAVVIEPLLRLHHAHNGGLDLRLTIVYDFAFRQRSFVIVLSLGRNGQDFDLGRLR